jgi:Lrp/AsnC family leucine-responsive transcriptional regulator
MKLKDSLFLEELDKNSRTPLNELAKKLAISNQAVHMKLKKFKDSNIAEYITVIDFFKLGYSNSHLYLKVRGMSPKEYNQKIETLKKISNITWICEFLGDYDLGISIFYKSLNELSRILDKIYSIFGETIEEKSIHLIKSHIITPIHFSKNRKTEPLVIEESAEKININRNQKIILKTLESNSRASYAEISKLTNLSIPSVAYNIRKLEENRIIVRYKTLLNYNSLGFVWSLCILEPIPGSNKKVMINSFNDGCICPFMSLTIENTLIADFLTEDHTKLRNFLNNLKAENKDKLKSYKIITTNRLIKLKNHFD